MRICIVTHKLVWGDGQGRVNYEIARAAADAGHKVRLVATQVDPDLAGRPNVEWERIKVARLPTSLLRELMFCIRSWVRIRGFTERPEIMHHNGSITRGLADVNTCHFVHTSWLKSPVHTSRVRRDAYGLYHYVYSRLNSIYEKRTYRGKSRIIVAVSDTVKNQLLDIGVPGEKIEVIYNGVDTEEFRPGTSQRLDLGVPHDSPCALFVGELKTQRKNLDTVLRAMLYVPGMHLVVIGGVEGSPYPREVRRHHLEGRVHFLGHRSDVSSIMRAVDLFVFPSRYEACSLVLIEALASGLPVVTAVTAGGHELVSKAGGYVLRSPDDVHELVAVMKNLALDAGERKRLGAAARLVAKEHTWSVMAKRYLELYAHLAGITSDLHTETAKYENN